MKHMYFKTCPYCGAHLDPGEICDCTHQDKLKKKEAIPMKDMRTELEYISGDLDTISRALDFICRACACDNSPEMLKNAIDSVRVAQTALVQNQIKLDSAIVQMAAAESGAGHREV